MENKLYEIAKELQITIEQDLVGQVVGRCYLFGHCLAKIFERLGYKSRKVTGKLAILIKKGQGKYVTYGCCLPLKGKKIGIFHTWCEVTFNGISYIVDPSLKSNLKFIEKKIRIKIHPKVEKDTLVTDTFNTYYYKYYEDMSLEKKSIKSLNPLTTKKQINSIIEKTLDNIQVLFNKKSA